MYNVLDTFKNQGFFIMQYPGSRIAPIKSGNCPYKSEKLPLINQEKQQIHSCTQNWWLSTSHVQDRVMLQN